MKYFESIVNWFKILFKPRSKAIIPLKTLFLRLKENGRFDEVLLGKNILCTREQLIELKNRALEKSEKLQARNQEVKETLETVLIRHQDLTEEMVDEIIKVVRSRIYE